MRRSTLVGPLIVSVTLVGLMVVLAVLQFQWLGQVSAADRESRESSLRERADGFADAFDGQLAGITTLLESGRDAVARSDWTAFAARYDGWRDASPAQAALEALFLVPASGTPSIERYDPASRQFHATAWPDALAPLREPSGKLAWQPERPPGGPLALWASIAIPSVPAIVVPVQRVKVAPARADGVFFFSAQSVASGRSADSTESKNSSRSSMAAPEPQTRLIAWLNRAYLQSVMLPALAARYFPADEPTGTYWLAIIDVSDPTRKGRPLVVNGWPSDVPIDTRQADLTVPLFTMRPPNLVFARALSGLATVTTDQAGLTGRSSAAGAGKAGARGVLESLSPGPSDRTPVVDSTSVRMVFETDGGNTTALNVATAAIGGWQLVLRHSAGSLDAAVGRTRRRNLWLSFGILSILASGVLLVAVTARRAERLAAERMRFVATVSHELRTPLAVIRSAAQNLSEGVVADPAKARQYGALIEAEGHRLTDMIEAVLDFAGRRAGARGGTPHLVDVGRVATEVLAACRTIVPSPGFAIESTIPPDLPQVAADEHAVRSAIQNLVTNALKYGANGGWLGLEARTVDEGGRAEVEITVRDRGPGIEPADLARVFEPFYRGRQAVDAQIPGSGLGLSLVKRLADACGGRVSVDSAPGEGASFSLALPAARADS